MSLLEKRRAPEPELVLRRFMVGWRLETDSMSDIEIACVCLGEKLMSWFGTIAP